MGYFNKTFQALCGLYVCIKGWAYYLMPVPENNAWELQENTTSVSRSNKGQGWSFKCQFSNEYAHNLSRDIHVWRSGQISCMISQSEWYAG